MARKKIVSNFFKEFPDVESALRLYAQSEGMQFVSFFVNTTVEKMINFIEESKQK